MQRDASAAQAAGGKTPVTASFATGLRDALLNQGLNELGLDATGAARFGGFPNMLSRNQPRCSLSNIAEFIGIFSKPDPDLDPDLA